MQFRLETFKSQNLENIKSTKTGSKNLFYTKILSNTNIGIEFMKPSL
jgi:hypothetical protein